MNEMDEEGEDMVRRALRDGASEYAPSPWSADRAGELHERVAGRRRTVRSAVLVGLAASATAAAAVLGMVLTSGSGAGAAGTAQPMAPGATATAAAPSHRASASATASPDTAWPAVRVVPSGRIVDLGHQMWMTLTANQRCAGLGSHSQGGFTCKSVTDGNQGQDSVGIQVAGYPTGTFYTPLYIGSGTAARMTITVDGKVYRATVVTLAGHPGYATGYLWGPPNLSTSPAKGRLFGETVTVYDAQGKVLATFG